MEVKELARKIKELNIECCAGCPFYKRDVLRVGCKLHASVCVCINVDSNVDNAEGLLQLEHFFETGEVKDNI